MIFLVLDTKSSIPGMMSSGDVHRNLFLGNFIPNQVI